MLMIVVIMLYSRECHGDIAVSIRNVSPSGDKRHAQQMTQEYQYTSIYMYISIDRKLEIVRVAAR